MSEENEELQITGASVVLTKKTMADFAEEVKAAVVMGDLDGLKALIHLKYMEKVAKEAYSGITEYAIVSAEKYEGSKGILDSAKFQVKAGGRYDYSHIEEWVNKKAELKIIEERAKQAYDMQLKGMTRADEQTGDVDEPAKYKSNATAVAITF